MRSYKQHCGLAKALDLVGDRWTLLIVRELLIRGGCRYTDLQKGLPGIATNLLAERLRELEAAGIVMREEAPPPIATTLFRLTERGKALEPAILQLGLWAAPLLARGAKGAVTQPHWLVLPLKIFLKDRAPREPGARIEVRAGHESIAIELSGGAVTIALGAPKNADAVVTGKPDKLLEFFAGKLDRAAASAAGIAIDDARNILDRIVPSVA
jgi:DNA-binding HxlR family transcriptional regulator